MSLYGKKDSLILLAGDILALVLALWLTLALRYWVWPAPAVFWWNLGAFAPLYLLWLIVFFISDLYRRQTLLLTRRLPQMLLRAQVINSLLAVLMFYFVPYFDRIGLTPKTNLFVYLVVALPLLLVWRVWVIDWVNRGRPVRIAFATSGEAVEELRQEIASHPKHHLILADGESQASVVVFNNYDSSQDHLLPNFYQRFFHGTRFLSVHQFYEALFERVPLSLVTEKWFLENVSNQPERWYAIFKRGVDIVLSAILLIVSSPCYLLIPLLIKLGDGGPVFYRDERVGCRGRVIWIYKFRSMSLEADLHQRRVTRLGAWLRRSRVDELPQLWSVLRGDQSLIGPRPEKPDYVALYREQIPYYDARHLIAPGLSGWAQLYQQNHPHFHSDLEATEEKLSYDLYYLKNRSWWLDLKIALKTIRALLSQTGI